MNDSEIKFLIFDILAQSPDGKIKIKYFMDKYEVKSHPDLCETIK